MKKLFILFLVTGLFADCNNNNPFAKNDGNTKNANKDEKKEKDDRKKIEGDDDENVNRKKDDYTDEDDSRSNWTTRQRDSWLNECIEASENNPQARKVCSCVLEKMEKKYPDSKDAENASEAEGTRLAKDCMADLGVGGGLDEQDRNQIRDRDDELNDNKGSSWSNLQRKQFIQGCAGTAQKVQGFTLDQANSYCDCMTRKVERKYSFREAAKLTATDFQTQEWIDAAAECRSANY